MAKTTRLNRFINKLACRFPRFWRVLWTIGIGFGFGAMIFGMIWLSLNLYALITAPQLENAVVPFIPGVTVTGTVLLYMILPIAIIAFCHEIAHGIASRIGGVRVKSSGMLALIFFFGAFVELDDQQVAKKKRLARQRIYAAGSFINLIIAFFALLLIVNMYEAGPGAYLSQVYSDGPSYGKLHPHEIILSVNGSAITYNNLSATLDPFKPFDPVLFTVQKENGTIENRTFIVGFNRRVTADTAWGAIQLFNGSKSADPLNFLQKYDHKNVTVQSANHFLNFSLILNLTTLHLEPQNVIALVVDLGLNSSIDTFDSAKVYLTNFSNPAQNHEFFNLQNFLPDFYGTGNISRVSGYNLTHFFNASRCLSLNFIFNSTIEFSLGIDLCRIYIIQNNTANYYGIGYKPNLLSRGLAIILGPTAPYIYQMLFYLYMFSFAIAIINLLPIPPFDGDKLFTSLFGKDIPPPETKSPEEMDAQKNEKAKPKEPWTWKKTVIWSVRGVAIFLFLSNIILSMLLFNIFTLFSSIF